MYGWRLRGFEVDIEMQPQRIQTQFPNPSQYSTQQSLLHPVWDPGSSLVMIPERTTFQSMKRALPKPSSDRTQSEGLTKTLQWQNTLWGSYHAPSVEHTADGLAESLTHRSYWSLCPHLKGLTKVYLNTQCQHTSNRGLTTTPPLPVLSLDIIVPSMKGPYQTPTGTTRTYRLRGKQTRGVMELPSLQEILTSQL